MPDLNWNREKWSRRENWERSGSSWSGHWGSDQAVWNWVIRPRIVGLLPASRLLEIAPGHGRITAFLLEQCDEYLGFDLNASCIEACRRRFPEVDPDRFRANDGRTLTDAADSHFDLVFSFDSLVHVDRDDLASYLCEIHRVLKPGGRAFLHHSNLGAHRTLGRVTERVTGPPMPYRIGRWLRRNVLVNGAWRSTNVDAETVARDAGAVGLTCLVQELVNWENRRRLIDCFTLLGKPADGQGTTPPDHPLRLVNRGFMADAYRIKNWVRGAASLLES